MRDGPGRDYARELIEQLRIKTDSPDKQARLLSGGNQQKVVIAKWLGNDHGVLILDEPTAGVDIGSKAEISGSSVTSPTRARRVLLISSELPELLAVSATACCSCGAGASPANCCANRSRTRRPSPRRCKEAPYHDHSAQRGLAPRR